MSTILLYAITGIKFQPGGRGYYPNCETTLGQMTKERMQEVRSDKVLEVSYMTYAQKMLDERRAGYSEGLRDAITALKGVLTPDVIAERFKMPLDQVMEILGRD